MANPTYFCIIQMEIIKVQNAKVQDKQKQDECPCCLCFSILRKISKGKDNIFFKFYFSTTNTR